MPNAFIVEESADGEISIVKPKGFLDAHTAPDFETAIQNQIDKGRHRLIIDCSDLNYISSAGLGVFMGFVEDLREKGGDIKICCLIPKVQQVFELLGFHELFHIVGSVPEAIEKFKDSPVWEE